MYSHFEFLGNTVHLYNVFLLLGGVAFVLVVERNMQSLALTEKESTLLRFFIPCSMLVGLLGATVFEIMVQGKALTINNFNIGLTFYGGLIAGVIFLIIYAAITKLPIVFLLNFYSSAVAVAHAIGRIGCFFAGCCFGAPTDLPFGIRFPEGSLPYKSFGSQSLHPTQLYESILLFFLFYLLNKINFTFRFPVYLIMYGIFRFLVEYLRADPRGVLLSVTVLSPSQVISLCMIASGISVLFFINNNAFLVNKSLSYK